MSDIGIKVSKAGYSVLSAQPNELAFSSSYASDLIRLSGRINHIHTGTNSTAALSHGLGGAYQFLIYDALEGTLLPLRIDSASPAGNDLLVKARINSTELVVEIYTAASETYESEFYYLIFTKPM